jgi:endonuclease/exonuclease/phosphatase (EEP) superfamily protein YafD
VPWAWFAVRDLSVVMEVVAVLLPVLVAGVAITLVGVAVGTSRPDFLAAAGSWVAFGVTAVVLPWLPHSTGTPVQTSPTIAVANVFADNQRPADAVRDLMEIDADVLVVPEARITFDVLLKSHYRFAARFPWGGAATSVYSRLPLTELPRPEGLFDPTRYVRVRVEASTPFTLWALHLPRPWLIPKGTFQMRPGGHARTISAFVRAIDAEQGPVVVAGDLNLTDRGRGYRKMTAHLDDAMSSIRGARSEVKPLYRPLLLSIDHILEPPDWCADRAGRFSISGSDHRGISARVGPCVSR